LILSSQCTGEPFLPQFEKFVTLCLCSTQLALQDCTLLLPLFFTQVQPVQGRETSVTANPSMPATLARSFLTANLIFFRRSLLLLGVSDRSQGQQS
jgi:hypothetical protein